MEKIDWKYVSQEAGDAENIIVPMALDYSCPYCSRVVHFNMRWTGTAQLIYVCSSRCSGCANNPRFIYVVEPGQKTARRVGELFIYPLSKRRKPFEGIEKVQAFPNSLEDEYQTAIRLYNLQEWVAASVMCRRLLEGLMGNLLPQTEHNKALYQQILIIDQFVDLKKPIKDIADVLRIAGNKGAHFDPLNKPNSITLELMLDLIDSLLEYFFVLPDKTTTLKNHVQSVSSTP